MAEGIKVVMNSPGCISLMNSSEIQAMVLSEAEKVRSTAESMDNGDYIADVMPGVTRAHGRVKTTGWRTWQKNSDNNTLLKSMKAGG